MDFICETEHSEILKIELLLLAYFEQVIRAELESLTGRKCGLPG